LACGDQRRLTGSGSALEAITRNALYKSTFTLLLVGGRHNNAVMCATLELLHDLSSLSLTPLTL